MEIQDLSNSEFFAHEKQGIMGELEDVKAGLQESILRHSQLLQSMQGQALLSTKVQAMLEEIRRQIDKNKEAIGEIGAIEQDLKGKMQDESCIGLAKSKLNDFKDLLKSSKGG